jgi:hypothetical protein
MKLRHSFLFLFLSALLALANGCMTRSLWTEAPLDNLNQPASPARLQVFQLPDQNDWLVVYDEYSERRDCSRTRAYLLNRNEARTAQHLRPVFSSDQPPQGSIALPVLSAPPASPPDSSGAFYAVATPDGQGFTIYSGNQAVSSHELPAYDDGTGAWKRAALTPLTATADLTIVGGYVLVHVWPAGYSVEVR